MSGIYTKYFKIYTPSRLWFTLCPLKVAHQADFQPFCVPHLCQRHSMPMDGPGVMESRKKAPPQTIGTNDSSNERNVQNVRSRPRQCIHHKRREQKQTMDIQPHPHSRVSWLAQRHMMIQVVSWSIGFRGHARRGGQEDAPHVFGPGMLEDVTMHPWKIRGCAGERGCDR